MPITEGSTGFPTDANGVLGGALYDGANLYLPREASADGAAVTGVQAAGNMGFNGTTWDRLRTYDALVGSTTTAGARATHIVGLDASGFQRAVFVAHGVADGVAGLSNLAVSGYGFNGTTWDRWRNNTEGTLLASAARTASTASADQTNYNARGALIHINVTANPGGGETLNWTLDVKDPISGTYFSLWNSADATAGYTAANGFKAFLIYPGAAETQDRSQLWATGLALPRAWRINMAHSAAGSWTYSVGYSLIV